MDTPGRTAFLFQEVTVRSVGVRRFLGRAALENPAVPGCTGRRVTKRKELRPRLGGHKILLRLSTQQKLPGTLADATRGSNWQPCSFYEADFPEGRIDSS